MGLRSTFFFFLTCFWGICVAVQLYIFDNNHQPFLFYVLFFCCFSLGHDVIYEQSAFQDAMKRATIRVVQRPFNLSIVNSFMFFFDNACDQFIFRDESLIGKFKRQQFTIYFKGQECFTVRRANKSMFDDADHRCMHLLDRCASLTYEKVFAVERYFAYRDITFIVVIQIQI